MDCFWQGFSREIRVEQKQIKNKSDGVINIEVDGIYVFIILGFVLWKLTDKSK